MLILVYAALSDSSNGGWKNIHIWTGNPLPSSYVKQSAPRSHSQCNQDKLVVKLYGEDFRGYFVDLAANDAVHISNTLMIERDYNWDGVCIEANPAYWFGLAHRKCTVIGAAVGKTDNEPMNFVDRGTLGAMSKQSGANSRHVRLVSLAHVFKAAKVPAIIDYMSFDVEGAELFIAQAFPWDSHQINLLTVEQPSNELQVLLYEKGMVYLQDGIDKITGHNFGDMVYCHKSKDAEFKRILNWTPPPETEWNKWALQHTS